MVIRLFMTIDQLNDKDINNLETLGFSKEDLIARETEKTINIEDEKVQELIKELEDKGIISVELENKNNKEIPTFTPPQKNEETKDEIPEDENEEVSNDEILEDENGEASNGKSITEEEPKDESNEDKQKENDKEDEPLTKEQTDKANKMQEQIGLAINSLKGEGITDELKSALISEYCSNRVKARVYYNFEKSDFLKDTSVASMISEDALLKIHKNLQKSYYNSQEEPRENANDETISMMVPPEIVDGKLSDKELVELKEKFAKRVKDEITKITNSNEKPNKILMEIKNIGTWAERNKEELASEYGNIEEVKEFAKELTVDTIKEVVNDAGKDITNIQISTENINWEDPKAREEMANLLKDVVQDVPEKNIVIHIEVDTIAEKNAIVKELNADNVYVEVVAKEEEKASEINTEEEKENIDQDIKKVAMAGAAVGIVTSEAIKAIAGGANTLKQLQKENEREEDEDIDIGIVPPFGV